MCGEWSVLGVIDILYIVGIDYYVWVVCSVCSCEIMHVCCDDDV